MVGTVDMISDISNNYITKSLGFSDHLVDLFVGEFLADVGHHVPQLSR